MHFEKPNRELFLGEIISGTFRLYLSRFALFYLPFLVAGLITGILTSALFLGFPLPAQPPIGASSTEVFRWLGSFISTLIGLVVFGGIVSWVIGSIATGMVVKSASDVIEKGAGNLQESFSFTMTKVPSLLVVSIITGILVLIGMLLLVVPGIILMIMFSLVVPAVIIEEEGAFDSIGRSSKLVSNRWLKTFALLIVIGLIIVVISLITSVVLLPGYVYSAAPPFGNGAAFAIRMIISGIVGSFVSPILPLAETLLYYSMVARESAQLPPPPPPF
jgi:hypothetical protein